MSGSGEGVMKEEKFPHSRKLSHRGSVGSFRISEGNITGRKKTQNPQNTRLTATAGENFPMKGSNLTA